MKLYFAWVIALAGTLLSFYLSEVEQIEPCPLCWFQRIALFPLAVQLGIAAYRSDHAIGIYAYPLCGVGFAFALFQTLLPWLPIRHLCGGRAGCGEGTMNLFGYLPFSWVSTVGFVCIVILLALSRKNSSFQ